MSKDIPYELREYFFEIPEELIAKFPKSIRDKARLLVWEKSFISDHYFYELEQFLRAGDLLILNSTKVSKKRVFLKRGSGGRHEVLFLNPENEAEGVWKCLIKNRSKLKVGEVLDVFKRTEKNDSKDASLNQFYSFMYMGKDYNKNSPNQDKKFETDFSFLKTPFLNIQESEDFFEAYGEMPIPPYLKRESNPLIDNEYYQTTYANKNTLLHSIAAPTAGLHFTENLLNSLKKNGVYIETLELQLGYGTFAPIKKENLDSKTLHTETYNITTSLAEILNRYKQEKLGRIIAVGTSTLRALESNYTSNYFTPIHKKKDVFQEGSFQTNLFLRPPDKIYSVDGLITNFHLPCSSLQLLVSCLRDKEGLLECYKHAIENKYYFYSYGDAMLII